jgi:hypothetical protein
MSSPFAPGHFMPFGFPMIPPSVSAAISHFCQTGDLKVSKDMNVENRFKKNSSPVKN